MKLSSWFRRSRSRAEDAVESEQLNPKQGEEEFLGVTNELIDYSKSFTLDTFKNFPLQDDEEAAIGDESQKSSSVREDLSDWQERHAVLVLSKVKELSQLRFKLCPRRLKEHQFWRIYFTLVKNHVAEYELHALQQEKLKTLRSAMGNGKELDAGANEVEMGERRECRNVEPSTL